MQLSRASQGMRSASSARRFRVDHVAVVGNRTARDTRAASTTTSNTTTSNTTNGSRNQEPQQDPPKPQAESWQLRNDLQRYAARIGKSHASMRADLMEKRRVMEQERVMDLRAVKGSLEELRERESRFVASLFEAIIPGAKK